MITCDYGRAFSQSNNTVSLKDVIYKEKKYQIHNEMYPFLLCDVTNWKCTLSIISNQLFSANEDRFLAKWISNHALSTEAESVYQNAKILYQYVYENLAKISWLDYKIKLWDIGWYQIRNAADRIADFDPKVLPLKQ